MNKKDELKAVFDFIGEYLQEDKKSVLNFIGEYINEKSEITDDKDEKSEITDDKDEKSEITDDKDELFKSKYPEYSKYLGKFKTSKLFMDKLEKLNTEKKYSDYNFFDYFMKNKNDDTKTD